LLDQNRNGPQLDLGFQFLRFRNAELDAELEGIAHVILRRAQAAPKRTLTLV
jgi:very-short-patch-repair endonuclease